MKHPKSAFGVIDSILSKSVSSGRLSPAEVGDQLDRSLLSMVTSSRKEEAKLQRCKSIKPIISQDLDQQIHAAVAQYTGMNTWNDWGMKYFRQQGACVLLKGPPGCGKTVIARYLASLLDKGIVEVDMSSFGSNEPGENERKIESIFREASNKRKTVFMDEVDAVLWDRSKAGADSMWMVSVIDKLLIELGRYRYLCILATNRDEMLDTALERRLIADIYVGKPEAPERHRMWKTKIPKQYPLQFSAIQLATLSEFKLTGAEIENAIIKETQLAIIGKRKPNFDSLCNVAKNLQK